MAIPKKPKLLYQVSIQRKTYFRRFTLALVVSLMACVMVAALNSIRGDVQGLDDTILVFGLIVAAIVAVFFGVRALFSLGRWIQRRDETLRIFDQGIVWARSGKEAKYGWSTLKSYRETGRGLYMGERILAQWGAHTLKMQDGRAFKVTGVYGDLRKLGALLRRPAAHVTGIQMGKSLRQEEAVKLHPQLTVWPGGVEVGKQEIPWSELDVRLKGSQLTIYRKNKAGKFAKVHQFNTRRMDNVGGFMEVATTTLRNHQRERFGV